MLGLLGGLIGGGLGGRAMSRPAARSPLAGLLARRGGGGSSAIQRSSPGMSSSPSPQEPPEEDSKPQPAEAAPAMEEATPMVTAPTQPFVETASKGIEQREEQRQEALQGKPEPPRPVTAGLLEPGEPATTQSPPMGTDAIPQPQSVVNQDDTSAPVARPAGQDFGSVPQVGVPGIESKLDEAPPRRDFPLEDPNPSQPAQMSQSAYTANAPNYRYSSAGTSTAYTPNYSYRR